jgi:phosphatidylglycerophosphatase A
MRPIFRKFVYLCGTFFYVGAIPGPGGTIGSLPVYLIAGILVLTKVDPLAWNIVFAGMLIIPFWLCVLVGRHAEAVFGEPDPNCVVLDEVAGAAVTLLFFPFAGKLAIPGIIGLFLAFRFFDIFKPLGIRRLEKVGHGFGIVLDDVGAGLITLILAQLSRFFIP